MDSLKIQDVFEPYYAGRKRFAALKEKSVPAEVANADSREAGKRLLRRLLADARTETDSTTEH
ncbi:hypothetical protein CN311_19085 [Mesorhizobium sanjuanii]|uniref:Uncharacterized protein n=1 Tax=Mesorhizobium sanjuanii TaxID=2037900 RepID=A0A2A6FCR8_9HYPH|nr:hypothetical protein [Mesorhizobium sanjuanii]PDQ19515.1 hypothetical protein CN311_19085 [Mesorhizobium sanjuanii]